MYGRNIMTFSLHWIMISYWVGYSYFMGTAALHYCTWYKYQRRIVVLLLFFLMKLAEMNDQLSKLPSHQHLEWKRENIFLVCKLYQQRLIFADVFNQKSERRKAIMVRTAKLPIVCNWTMFLNLGCLPNSFHSWK